jgi:hypothetical protein
MISKAKELQSLAKSAAGTFEISSKMGAFF